MQIIKKQTFYQFDPRFYNDSTGNGTGDLKGTADKADYFDFLGVENIILQNLLALDEDQKVQNYTKIAQELGTEEDLKKIISLLNSKEIKLFMEIPIGSIKESHEWFQKTKDASEKEFENMVDFKSNVQDQNKTRNFKYSEEKQGYYEFDERTREIPLNWASDSVIEQFAKVMRYWNEAGVSGFVITGFEYISDHTKKNIMSDQTLKELRKFYNTIKEINDDIIVVGKSKLIFNNGYTKGLSKVFDYFMTDQFSLLGTHKRAGTDLIGKFKTSKLAKMLKLYATTPGHIVTFGSRLSGRINSRWGNSGQWSHESAKLISMLLFLNPGSSSIYYGDEIGALNIGLTRLDDFQDDELFIRRENLLKDGSKDLEIMEAQILQNPINSRTLMAWDDSKNGGFSNNEKTITPVSTTYQEINVKNQFIDESSPLLFTKELLRMITKSSYRKIFTDGKFSISSFVPGVIKMTFKLEKKEIRIYANMTDKTKLIKKPKTGHVILSNKYHKVYKRLPKWLDAFEGIIIYKQTDEAYKETVQLKLHKEKIEAHEKKEIDRQIKEKTKLEERTKAEENLILKEKQAISKMKEEVKKFELMDGEIDQSERTTLTEAEIAATTQIDADKIDDFEEFLRGEEKNKK